MTAATGGGFVVLVMGHDHAWCDHFHGHRVRGARISCSWKTNSHQSSSRRRNGEAQKWWSVNESGTSNFGGWERARAPLVFTKAAVYVNDVNLARQIVCDHGELLVHSLALKIGDGLPGEAP